MTIEDYGRCAIALANRPEDFAKIDREVIEANAWMKMHNGNIGMFIGVGETAMGLAFKPFIEALIRTGYDTDPESETFCRLVRSV